MKKLLATTAMIALLATGAVGIAHAQGTDMAPVSGSSASTGTVQDNTASTTKAKTVKKTAKHKKAKSVKSTTTAPVATPAQ